MAVKFENYTHSFKLKGKPVFAPTQLSYRIGRDIKARVEAAYTFDRFFYHLQPGGHVAALHAHRSKSYFCKVDIETFFYSIGRNRIIRCLKDINIKRPVHYARWSCVKNPYESPSYALPYGFVQSPILATLVLATSELGAFIRDISRDITVAIYVDDISISSNDLEKLREAYGALDGVATKSGFTLNKAKSVAPCSSMEVFNCTLSNRNTTVKPDRISEFYDTKRTSASVDGFEKYCLSVSDGNSDLDAMVEKTVSCVWREVIPPATEDVEPL
jgi:hypothetical protein